MGIIVQAIENDVAHMYTSNICVTFPVQVVFVRLSYLHTHGHLVVRQINAQKSLSVRPLHSMSNALL